MKAIETRYKGYRFRSRLEARWAVFFDTLGFEYEYEKEGFEFDGLRYLPDFWIPCLDSYWEVKGQPLQLPDTDGPWQWMIPDEETWAKAACLAVSSGKRVFVSCGECWGSTVRAVVFDDVASFPDCPGCWLKTMFDLLPPDSWGILGCDFDIAPDEPDCTELLRSVLFEEESPHRGIWWHWDKPNRLAGIHRLMGKVVHWSTGISFLQDKKGKRVISTSPLAWPLPVDLEGGTEGVGDYKAAFEAARSARFEHGETPCSAS